MALEPYDEWSKRIDERLQGMVRRLTIVQIIGFIPTALLVIFFL